MSTDPHRGPLHTSHIEAGATLGVFGGWEMPIYYSGGGVVVEHTVVREAVGVFDVTHLGKISITGPGAADFVNSCLTADLAKIGPGQAQYTLCCAEDGGVVDDLIAYLIGPDEVFCVPNAANTREVGRRLAAAAPPMVTVTDQHDEYAVLAVQGPRSAELLAAVGLAPGTTVAGINYLAFADAQHDGVLVRVGRTGYTGERGYELLPPWKHAPALWAALLAAAGPLGGRACGLGARDTLRTEMGYLLHGQDLGPDITPLQGGISWAIGWDKPAFWGREALLAERDRGPSRRMRGLRATARGVPRPHMAVWSTAGAPLGETTSGTFSPTLHTGIALALLDPAVRPGDSVEIDVRGRALPCEVVRPPFVPSHVR
ncbi:MAG: glycine cleavage system aminomethyltransferase GcvT [Pseudonocardiales bacterium]|nr:glycine cleavage system aminomethyltransferase GcvT [Pseudonocardiales bacterium]MBV9728622.1 glycine cleavage system aminomethyltransferase GcvT [Pseudonocardiales bacterium]